MKRLLVVLALAISACAAANPSAPPTAAPAELTVFGAASLRNALARAETDYEAASGQPIVVSTGASSALRTQIEEGAAVDVFLSADAGNARALVEADLVEGEPVSFASNRLVIVVPTANPAGIESPADLANDDVVIIAARENVPITRYATELVANLAALEGYPEGFVEAYAANIASQEDDVRAVLNKIALGEGDAAIVYATDALSTDDVAVIEVPDEANVPADYQGVVLADAPSPDQAQAFLDWWAGAEGQAILESFGFGPPN